MSTPLRGGEPPVRAPEAPVAATPGEVRCAECGSTDRVVAVKPRACPGGPYARYDPRFLPVALWCLQCRKRKRGGYRLA